MYPKSLTASRSAFRLSLSLPLFLGLLSLPCLVPGASAQGNAATRAAERAAAVERAVESGEMSPQGLLPPAQPTSGSWERWPEAQPLSVPPSGIACVVLPHETLARLSTEKPLSDLRLVSDTGAEIPYVTLVPRPAPSERLPASRLQPRLESGFTSIGFNPPDRQRAIVGIQFDSPTRSFNKPFSLEGSNDRKSWELLVDRFPAYREGDSGRMMEIPVPHARYAHYRLRLGDEVSPPVPITGLWLRLESAKTPAAAPGPVRLVRREELRGETRLTLEFPSHGAFLSSLQLALRDTVFRRHVRLVYRDLVDDQVQEKVLARGLVSRVPPSDGAALPSALHLVSVEQSLPAREMILVIENGDSPPLDLASLTASYRPVAVLFPSPPSGKLTLLAGARQVDKPHYDLASFPNLRDLRSSAQPYTPAEFGPFAPNPEYRPGDSLPDFPLLGAALAPGDWASHRQVTLSAPGVQFLDLDHSLLAATRGHFADLRLVRDGRQVPFLIENCRFQRRLPLSAERVEKAPSGVSRWTLRLPVKGLPLDSLRLSSTSPLFERSFLVYEDLRNSRGENYRSVLGQQHWARQGDASPSSMTLRLSLVTGDTLILETTDGDNSPIVLSVAEAAVPVVRLHFKTADTSPLQLLHGNPKALLPSYDLRLVARQLLSAPHSEALLGAAPESNPDQDPLLIRLSRNATYLFWAVLILVVGSLLFVIARMLPKSHI